MHRESKDSFEKATGRDRYFAALEEEISQLIDPGTGLLDARFSQPVECAVCGADEPSTLFVKRGFTFVRCGRCGHIYCNPQVVEDRVTEAYRSSAANERWAEVLLNPKNQEWQREYFRGILGLIEEHRAPGRLLDVGCSIGLFLDVARERGWEGVGLELGEMAVQHARERGLDVRAQRIEEADFPEGSFDVVTAFGLMEHLNDPRSMVERVARILKPGGVFTAVSPNTYSLASMVLREKMPTFDGRNHLQYYTYDSFRRLVEQAGLRVLRLDTALTALPTLRRYFSYRDPYGDESAGEGLPPHVEALFAGAGQAELEDFLYRNHLGLRLRVIAQRPE